MDIDLRAILKYMTLMIMTTNLHGSATGIIAHRGGGGLFPENTICAIEHALKLGVSGIEIDVQLSADGEIVVFHDFFLKPDIVRDRYGNWLERSDMAISQLTINDLKAMQLGLLKPGSNYESSHPGVLQSYYPLEIPTLAEVLALFKPDSATKLWVEIKTSPCPEYQACDPIVLSERILAMVDRLGLENSVVLLSFDWRALTHVRQYNEKIPLCFLTYDCQTGDHFWPGDIDLNGYANFAKAIADNGGKIWGLNWQHITPQVLADAKDAGIAINAWTVNDPEKAKELLAMGVDLITSDYPDAMLGLL